MKKNNVLKKVLLFTIIFSMTILAGGCSADKNADETITESSVSNELTTDAVNEETPTSEADSSVISSFDDVNTDKVQLIALGNNDVPVGQYSEEIFTSLGMWADIQSKISFGTNVKEVLSQVAEGSVDCGIVYATDAATEDDVSVVCKAPADSMKTPVVYPFAALKSSANIDAAKLFLNYLLTDNAVSEFEKIGFKMNTNQAPAELSYDGECTLTVFSAASLTESLTAITDLFTAEYPNINVVLNFDSSGTLKTQIESGAEADIFISAAQKQMTGLSDGGYIDDSTKIDLLENEVVLIVPKS